MSSALENYGRGTLVLLAALVAAVGPARPAHAGYLWDWLFGNRNHAYYAGPQPQATGQMPAMGPNGAPAVAGTAVPQSAAAGWPQGAVYSPPAGSFPPSTPTMAGYPPAGGTPAPGTTQQLTTPWVIIPSSSAPIGGPSSTPAGSGSNGTYANGSPPSSVSAGYAPAATNGGSAAAVATYNGQPAQQVASVPVQATYSVPAAQQQVWSIPAQASLAVQPQQTFMVQQGSQANSWGSCLPGHSGNTASYRTVWYRVPTTNVRPVAAVDPCTGATTTVMRPCTTYTWQARRVPTMRTPSLCERLFSCFRRPPPPVLPAPMAMTTNYACGPACYPAAPAGTAAPYYAPPATTPATSAGSVSAPYGGTSLPATAFPSGAYPSPPGTTTVPSAGAPPSSRPGGGVPADYPPTLEPRRYPPAEAEPGPTDGEKADGAQEEDHPSRDSSAAYPTGDTVRVPLRAPQLGPANSASIKAEAPQATGSRGMTPRPVPDPASVLKSPPDLERPRLVNPHDRRASRPVQRAGDFVLVSWNEVTRTSPDTSAAPITPPRLNSPDTTPRLPTVPPSADDRGWRSAPR